MRLSPGMRDNLAKRANKELNAVTVSSMADTNSLHIKLIDFEEDRKHLRSFNAIADRVEHKRSVLVPKYKPYVQAYLESGDQFENPIFTNLVIWLFDIKELDTAIDWCMKAIERDLPTPENFRRDWPTFCADEVLAWAERESERGHSIQPYFSQIFEKVHTEWRLHEKVQAKWYKFAGLSLIRNEDGNPQATAIGNVETLEKALALLQLAHEKHRHAGVGTQVKKIEQRIRAIKDGKNL
ncbi:terminase [Aliivibrio salmonicida]|uniref:Phage terminase, endonuclease subunit n=1 Tax=Aliivibrio salmonicida (strain LFI1238) TaxID=316275 RepID=B6EIS0_ALISL|nr:phage terminase small subunit [Aliivibrio salmonicida]AZL84369.1 terminase [Aliivibrio salmonicida]CAQ78714.1 phage terminase, endonuclease subunit [Aliivibrio salmonicida LFI1238]